MSDALNDTLVNWKWESDRSTVLKDGCALQLHTLLADGVLCRYWDYPMQNTPLPKGMRILAAVPDLLDICRRLQAMDRQPGDLEDLVMHAEYVVRQIDGEQSG